MQCKAGEAVFTQDCRPPYVKLAEDRPELMAFYARLKEKVFPDGPSKNWSKTNWNPSQDPDKYESPEAAADPSSTGGDATATASATS